MSKPNRQNEVLNQLKAEIRALSESTNNFIVMTGMDAIRGDDFITWVDHIHDQILKGREAVVIRGTSEKTVQLVNAFYLIEP